MILSSITATQWSHFRYKSRLIFVVVLLKRSNITSHIFQRTREWDCYGCLSVRVVLFDAKGMVYGRDVLLDEVWISLWLASSDREEDGMRDLVMGVIFMTLNSDVQR